MGKRMWLHRNGERLEEVDSTGKVDPVEQARLRSKQTQEVRVQAVFSVVEEGGVIVGTAQAGVVKFRRRHEPPQETQLKPAKE